MKISLALTLASISALSYKGHSLYDSPTYWACIAITQTMSPQPTSSFKSGMNRIQGTAFGAIFGMATLEWFTVDDGVWIPLMMGLWVALCR